MKSWSLMRAVLLLSTWIVSGCTSFSFLDPSVRTSGAHPLFDREKFEQIDDLGSLLLSASFKQVLVNARGDGNNRIFTYNYPVQAPGDVQVFVGGNKLDPSQYTVTGIGSLAGAVEINIAAPAPANGVAVVIWQFRPISRAKSQDGNQEDIFAFIAIFENQLSSDPNALMIARNSVQERIIAASNERCGVFKNHLQSVHADANFFFGSASTILGGLGAIFTPAATVRALAGAAGITSGVRGEWNQDYFNNLAVQVITAGIDSGRDKLYQTIKQSQGSPYASYTVMAAINDAVTYHAACSSIVGLQVANASIQQANPSLTITPSSISVARNVTQTFTVTGGVQPYTFSLRTTIGSTIIPNTGSYTAGTPPGTDTITVTDSSIPAKTATATVTVHQ